MLTLQEIYENTIRRLPPSERLQLAAIILNDIPPQSVVDYSEEWSEQDQEDFSRANWQRLDKVLEVER
jgi:hypothetical protein